MSGAIGAGLGIATAAVFLLTAFWGFAALITDHTGAWAMHTTHARWNDSADITAETLLRQTVDQLAILKRDIAELQAQEEALKIVLASAGFAEIEGSMHRVTVTHDATRKTINWQAVAKCFNPSADLIEANTTTSEPFDIVRIGAKKTH
jgi:hypothetical protein